MYREEELVERVTGQVVANFVVEVDAGQGHVRCGRCGPSTPFLRPGNRVTAALYCYENHSWEVHDVYCANHAPATIADAMDVRAEEQALVRATLESTEYRPPYGDPLPDALTLGSVEVVHRSPTSEGW